MLFEVPITKLSELPVLFERFEPSEIDVPIVYPEGAKDEYSSLAGSQDGIKPTGAAGW